MPILKTSPAPRPFTLWDSPSLSAPQWAWVTGRAAQERTLLSELVSLCQPQPQSQAALGTSRPGSWGHLNTGYALVLALRFPSGESEFLAWRWTYVALPFGQKYFLSYIRSVADLPSALFLTPPSWCCSPRCSLIRVSSGPDADKVQGRQLLLSSWQHL